MLPLRSLIQSGRCINHPCDEKVFSTYQDEYNSANTHGNLVKHTGNSAYLARANTCSLSMGDLHAKPFLSPSYANLNSDSYIANRFSDNYSNNYVTSNDNVLRRSMPNKPTKTKLDHLYRIKIAPISKKDEATAYEQEMLHGRVNDTFVSHKWLKTDTINLRDTLVRYSLFYPFRTHNNNFYRIIQIHKFYCVKIADHLNEERNLNIIII